MRTFCSSKKIIASHDELAQKLFEVEKHMKDHDERIQAIFEAIQQLVALPETKKRKI